MNRLRRKMGHNHLPARGFLLENTTFVRLLDYIKETRGELKHVSWATRKQAFVYTALVVGISLVTAVILGAIDLGLSTLVEQFVI